ncbi:MAG: uncharacterized membrane protein YjjP (DUF1212 family) [Phycisphaerales bacterium]
MTAYREFAGARPASETGLAGGGGLAGEGEPDERALFLLELGLALSGYGAASYRVEEALELAARGLKTPAEFFVMPTSLFASIGESDSQRVFLRRMEPGDPHLEKLALVDRVFNEVGDGELGVHEGRERLRQIATMRERYPVWMIALCFVVIGGGAGVFLGGGWREAASSAVVSFVVGLLVLIGGRTSRWRRLTDFLAGFVSAVLVGVGARYVWPLDVPVVLLAGLIALVPGLTLTLAMGELSMKHLVSGSTRLIGALMIFVAIGFGVGFGSAVSSALGAESGVAVPVPGWVTPITLAVSTVAVGVFFRARPQDFLAVLAGTVSAFYGARLGGLVLDPRLGVFVGAFALGVVANGYARLRDRPSAIVSLPGMLLLVPGGLGLRGFTELMGHDALGGVETVTAVTIVGAGLVTGLLMASAVVPPRKVL